MSKSDGPPISLPSWPPQHREIREAITEAVDSGDWAKYGASATQRLTSALRDRHKREHVHLCGSGTAGIDFAVQALSAASDSEIVIAGFDYPGNIRSVERIGARPVLVDIAANRWRPATAQIVEAFSTKTSAVLISHLYGDLCDMKALRSECESRGVTIIEDACQVPAAIIDNQPAAGWGDISVLSFGSSKLLSAGCGGAIMTSDARLDQRIRLACERPSHVAPMSSLQAAALLPQLDALDQLTARRTHGYDRLRDRLSTSKLWRLRESDIFETLRAFFKIPWRLPEPIDRQTVLTLAAHADLPLGEGFVGFTRRAKRTHRCVGDLINSQRAATQTVVMDHRVLLLDDATIDEVASRLKAIENEVSRNS